MKKLTYIIFTTFILISCSKNKNNITPPQTPTTTVYTLHFKISQDEPTTYNIQTLNSNSNWSTIKSIPDTSKSGEYYIDLNLVSKEQIRVQALQADGITNSPIVIAAQ